MSNPNIPNVTPIISLTRDQTINLLLASIAMEELGLAHIMNAEGEKIQYVLGTLPGSPRSPFTIQDILTVNESAKDMLETVLREEMMLESKLKHAIKLLTGKKN